MSEIMWKGYKNGNVYNYDEVEPGVVEIINNAPENAICKCGKIEYLNIPASFDIETTSWKDEDDNKFATMYVWQFGVNGTIFMGREWSQLKILINSLVDYLDLTPHRRLIVYVHNLGYEFQFMRKWFNWDKVFAIKRRRPVYAVTGAIEFRCSLFLSN